MRTGATLTKALAAAAVFLAAHYAFALELGIDGGSGNLQFPDATTPIADSVFPATNYYWAGEAWLGASLGEDATLRVSYDRDPVLRNTAIAAVQFERGIARISVGPMFGFLNSDSSPWSVGLSASVRLQWPGVAYVSMRSDGATAISLFAADSDPQARTELAAGLYVPHAIVSGLISAKRFNRLDASGSLVTDSLTRYAMTIDIFKKNVPYTVLLSLGYDLRSKHYAATNTTDSLGAAVVGLNMTSQIGQAFKLNGGISTGAYVFGLGALSGRGPDSSSFLFSADLGLSVDVSAIKIPPKKAKEPVEEPKPAAPPAAAPAPAEKPPAATTSSKKPGIAIHAGSGIFYDAHPLSGTVFDFLQVLYSLRGGFWGDLMLPLKGGFGVGAELGVYYMTSTDSAGDSTNLFDAPLNAKLSYTIGGFGLDAFGGLYSTGLISASSADFAFGLDAGGRLRLGAFYLEGGYVLGLGGMPNYPRFGLGFSVPVSSLGSMVAGLKK